MIPFGCLERSRTEVDGMGCWNTLPTYQCAGVLEVTNHRAASNDDHMSRIMRFSSILPPPSRSRSRHELIYPRVHAMASTVSSLFHPRVCADAEQYTYVIAD